MTRTTYHVTGMTCAHCAAAVTEEVAALSGVASVQVDLETGSVLIEGTGVPEDAVRAAVDEAGYAVA